MERVAAHARRLGYSPFLLPQMIDVGAGGRCVVCTTCDGFPCKVGAKADAELCAMSPALVSETVQLLTNTRVEELIEKGGHVIAVRAMRDGRLLTIRPSSVVLAAGAINTAALLLRSVPSDRRQSGLANRSQQVGRNYMAHVLTDVVGVVEELDGPVGFRKTLGLNDWYFRGEGDPYPWGNVQAIGKMRDDELGVLYPELGSTFPEHFMRRTIEFLAQTEDLPQSGSQVLIAGGRIQVLKQPSNERSHARLVGQTRLLLREAGCFDIRTRRHTTRDTAHQCGTARMGDDPSDSVVDPSCCAHDVDNLFICDTSVFPSSAAVNPALTVAALALRLATSGVL